MPTEILSSVVFVGSEFKAALFDERDLCDGFGPLDKEPIRAGPIGRFSYSSGKYEFWIAPDRIDIRCREMDLIPQRLLDVTTHHVISVLEPIKKAIPISGIGINCDTIFNPRDIGQEGEQFCRTLTNTSLSQGLLPEQTFDSAVIFAFLKGDLSYNIRIEPVKNSQGRNLFFAVNGHQNVVVTDLLEEKLKMAAMIREETRKLHDRLRQLSKTIPQGG